MSDITVDEMRDVYTKACTEKGGKALADVAKLIRAAAAAGLQHIDFDDLPYGVDKELRARGFSVVDPSGDVRKYTVGWHER